MTAVTASEAVEGIVDAIETDLAGLDNLAGTADDELAVVLLAACAQIAKSVGQVRASAERRILETHRPGETVMVPGVGVAPVKANPKKRYKGGALALALAARVADSPPANEDGEPLPPAEWCRLTAEDIVAVFGLGNQSQGFRSGEVEKRGLRPGAFVEFVDGTPKVDFVSGAS